MKKLSRKKEFYLNTGTSLLLQITTVVCGFMLPRLILGYYGSKINGLISSISQFLTFITFMEMGVGGVIQANLYKPIAENDDKQISRIVVSANRFFKKMGLIILIYIGILILIFPIIINSQFNFLFTATLILTIGINLFAQYYFGIVNQTVIKSAQKGYFQYIVSILILIINTAASALLIRLGAPIQVVKFTTAIISFTKPIAYKIYISRLFHIDEKIHVDGEPIKQKWNGIAQHIAATVQDSTDVIVLTTFSTLENVSVYSVFHMILTGIRNLIGSLTQGIETHLGDLWARNEIIELKRTFGWFEWIMHTLITSLFGCTIILIQPFILVYTKSIDDANYTQPLFGFIITLATMLICLRWPYSLLINAAGRFKKTQYIYITSAVINLLLSIITVYEFGLVGVAIGTLASMCFECICFIRYCCKHIIHWEKKITVKQLIIDALIFIVGTIICNYIEIKSITYIGWMILGLKIFIVWLLVSLIINSICYRPRIKALVNKIEKKRR